MAKINFRQQKRQRELARKERQTERLSRRGERPPDEAPATAVVPDATVVPEIKPPEPPGGGT
jgi:hypothetical protein